MTKPFLLEIGVEELPVSYMNGALSRMAELLARGLSDARLAVDGLHVMGTPRRLAIMADSLSEKQSDVNELVMGPPKRVGVAEDGSFTKAAIGFAKKQGFGSDALSIQTTDKGEYIAVQRNEKGKPAALVLPELLAQFVGSIPFKKPMRWSNVGIPFGRPIQWLVALLGDEVVDFTFAGIRSGRQSRGHRFLSPGPVEFASANEYVDGLKNANVCVNLEERKALTESLLLRAAKSLSVEMIEDPFLLEECASLVEFPFVVPGQFESEYLSLPESVVIGVMRDHQRYLSVRDPKTKKLAPHYLNVVNTAGDPAGIAKGNDRVLRARLKDAQFFVVEDKKKTLESRVPELDKVTFQHQLGSIGDKVRRMGRFLESNAAREGGADETAAAAAQLAKADLVTLIVNEFGELQGEMGRYYAEGEGVDSAVALAIEEHYQPKGKQDSVASSIPGAWVGVADKLDTLTGCFGVGIKPTGSTDPFALRRAALGVIRTALEGPIDVCLAPLVSEARRAFEEPAGVKETFPPKDEHVASVLSFFTNRLVHHYKETARGDVVGAVISAWINHRQEDLSLQDLDARMKAVAAFVDNDRFDALAVAFKRAHNITKEHKGTSKVDASLLEAGAEADLASAFSRAKDQILAATRKHDYATALNTIADELGAPIDAYFEEVFVMADDEKLRHNRLNLLSEIAEIVTQIASFHELSS